ncbi:senescence-associated protein DIN1-like [Hibiscus syriacus]|uniref:Senescence-associated protein DIN1-like n=1 Tax=Hibiscus syriacus TaxID=106335 RepID=A0A6A3CYR8_HIBSY|nr:senescence-associated protein DIN1-like [Hibiscus syriacus]
MIPVFNGESYEFWSIKMKTLFKSQDLWDLVENGYTEPDEEARLRDNKKDSKALFFIQQAVHETIFLKIATDNTTKEAWGILQTTFQGSSKSHEARLNITEEKTEDRAFHEVMAEDKAEAMDTKIKHNNEITKGLSNAFTVKKFWHVKADCWRRSKQEQTSYAEQEDDEIKLFKAYQENAASHRNIWFLDSGCSNHMTGVKSLFNEIDETFKQKVTLGDNKKIQVEGKGNVAVKSSSGNVKLLYDVYYIPSLSQNLLSVGQLMATGYSIMFDDASCVIKDKKSDQNIVDVHMTPNKLFPLVISDVQNHALAVKETSESRLWHLRRGLRYLELVHADVFKSETFEKFKRFKALVEKQTGRCIKALRTDRGGEFVSNEFNSLCEEHVVEMARSMLKAKGLPNPLWAEAVATAVYLLNLSPTRVVLNKLHMRLGTKKYLGASSNGSISSDDETPPKKFKTLAEIYASTQALFVADPITFEEAVDKEEWKIAMKEEIAAIQHGNIQKHKARLVEKGYSQQPGVNFDDTFSPVARFETIRIVLALAAHLKRHCISSMVEDGIFVSQKKYDADLLKKLNMTGCKIAATPMNLNEKLKNDDGTEATDARSFRSLVGGLIYLTNTRPYISFAVGVISRFIHCPSRHHFGAAKRVLRYITGTLDFVIWYDNISKFNLSGYTDSDWDGSLEDRRSTSGYIFGFGSGVVCWSSKKQATTALSSSEAEYTAATLLACQALWLRRILADISLK